MSEFDTIKAIEDEHQLLTYSKHQIALERGAGAYVYDSEGNRYLDFYSGHAVAITGHCHPRVVEAVRAQAGQLMFYSNLVYSSIRAKASEALTSIAPPHLKRVFLCNSGAEANETAIKMARRYTGRPYLISMTNGFHGRTYGAMSITGMEKYRQFPPHLPGILFADFGDIESVRKAFEEAKGEVAAVILEPIQSMAGMRMAEPEFYVRLRELCDSFSSFLIFDEVQTAVARTGRWFFGDHVGVQPDLITTAKSIASGIPMGVVFVPEFISSTIALGEHGTTFGGGQVACAAAEATISVIRDEGLVARAERLGSYLKELLRGAGIENLVDVRGLGLLIGLEFSKPVKDLGNALLRAGLIVGTSEDKHVLRLIPPLIIGNDHCQEAAATIESVAKKVFSA